MPGHNANFSKIRQGAPLSAVTGAGYHNAIRDVLKWATKEMNRSGRGFSALDFDPGLVLVHNNSGSNRQQYDILGINNYAYITPSTNLSEFQSRRLLTGVTPLSPTHSGKFVVCLDAIPQGQVGRAVACGVIPAQIYLTPGASSPTLADVVNNQASYLQPAQTGAQVLYCDPAPSTAGPVWSYIRIPTGGSGARILFGQTTGALSSGNPIVNNITPADNGSGVTTNASDSITVTNWCGWTWSGASGVTIMFTLVSLTGTPGSGANIGTGNFLQAPCGA